MGSVKCIIPAIHLKVFGRAIQSLSKIGDELYFEPLDEGLSLRTVNSSRSAYACFQFAPSFFTSYVTDQDDDNCSEEGLRCKMTMKSVMNVFRSLPTIDKTVEKCKIALNMREDKMIFEMFCRHGIVKTHNLTFMDCETLQAVFSRDLCPNKLTANPKVLCDAVLNFQPYQEEVTLILRPDFVALKNYVEDEPNPARVIHTELTLSPDEFDYFQVGVDVDVTFCLKEFRAVLGFADLTTLPLNIHIEAPGRPVTFAITSDLTFEANFVLATLADLETGPHNSQVQAHMSKVNGKPQPSKSQGGNKRKLLSKNQNAQPQPTLHSQNSQEGEEDMSSMHINDTTLVESRIEPQPIFTKSSNTQSCLITYKKSGDLNANYRHQDVTSHHMDECNKQAGDRFKDSSKTNVDISTDSRTKSSKPQAGFYVSPSEESQSQSNMEIGRGGGQDGDSRKETGGVNIDWEEDMSQIIPIGNETSVGHSTSHLSPAMDEDDDDDDEQICATPPSKRFRSLFFSTQSSTQSSIASQNKPAILCPDSDSDG